MRRIFPDQCIALMHGRVQDVSFDFGMVLEKRGRFEREVVDVETQSESNILRRVALPVMRLNIMKKTRPSVTSRPPVDQVLHSPPSRPSVPNRSRYHSWPLIPTTAAKTTANTGLACMNMPQMTETRANGRKRLQENRSAFSRNAPSPRATTAR